MTEDLDEIRMKLNEIDKKIIEVLSERMKLIPNVAIYKKENNIERCQPEREKEVINSKKILAEEKELNPDLVEDLFKRIIEDAHRIEKEIIGK